MRSTSPAIKPPGQFPKAEEALHNRRPSPLSMIIDNTTMEDINILNLLCINSEMQPPSCCKQSYRERDNLASFIRKRVDHITAAFRKLKRAQDHLRLNKISCQIFVRPGKIFDEDLFMRLVRQSKGHQPWFCCGPQQGEPSSGPEHIIPLHPISLDLGSPHGDGADQYISGLVGQAATDSQGNPREDPAAITKTSVSDIRRRYEAFRVDMIDKVKNDITTLKTAILSKINRDATKTPHRTRQSQTSIEDLLTSSLEDFTTNLMEGLDKEFDQRFSDILDGSNQSATQFVQDSNHHADLSQAQRGLHTGATQQPSASAPTSLMPHTDGEATSPPSYVQDGDGEDPSNEEAARSPTPHADGEATSLPSNVPDGDGEDPSNGEAARSPAPARRSQRERRANPTYTGQTAPQANKRAAHAGANSESKRAKITTSPVDLTGRILAAGSVRRFMAHVTAWRAIDMPITRAEFCINGGWDERAAGYWKLAGTFGDSSNLHKLLSLIARIQVARHIDEEATALGYRIVPKHMIQKVLEKQGSEATKTSRTKFQDWLKQPRKLMKIFGPYLGLIPFVPLDQEDSITVREVLGMREEHIPQFQSLLEASKQTEGLSAIGGEFQECVLSGREFPRMIWEELDAQVLNESAAARLEELMRFCTSTGV